MSTKNQSNKEGYDKIKRKVRRAINFNRNETWDKKCKEIDTYIGGRKCSEVWKFIKSIKTTGKEKETIQVIPENKWIKHYQELLTENRPKYREESIPINVIGERVEIKKNEVVEHSKKLKNGKSCGPEGIYAELVKNGTAKLHELLTHVYNRCLNGQETPKEWKEAHIISVHKKGNKDNCENYRGLSITSTVSRLYGKILRDLIEREIKEEEEQCGFRGGRSSTDHIFCMKQIIEKRAATNQETHILFIDLTKAYDNIPICKI